VNPGNDWVDHLTVAELNKMWASGSEDKVSKWSEIRAGWPDEEFQLFGPGTDSGTFDYFTKVINGTEDDSRGDFTPNEDDNVLVQGVAGSKNALAYFGYAYYIENKDSLKIVPIDDGKADNGEGPIAPSVDSVSNGTYQPLSRPIYIYLSLGEAKRPEVKAFVEFYLSAEGRKLVKEVGYIPMPDAEYEKILTEFKGKLGA
ncbi:MAG: substrate-binding domain-containing protein, partial [Myxococcota bacterium]